jgi:integrase
MSKIKHFTDEDKRHFFKMLFLEVTKNVKDEPVNLVKKKQFLSLIKNACALYLLYETGARANEFLNLTLDDIQKSKLNDKETIKINHEPYLITHSYSLHIKGLKGSNDRLAHLSNTASFVLDKLLSLNKKDSGKITALSYAGLRKAFTHFAPKTQTLHSLRHTRAIDVYKHTKDIHLCKYLLGHKSIQNTMIYVDFVENREKLKKVADDLAKIDT